MESEEKYLEKTLGRQCPFRVPDGYFDQLASRVMSQLPEQEQPAKTVHLRSWLYAAACMAVAAMMGVTYYFHQEVEGQPQAMVAENSSDNTYIEEEADYMMIDNAEIYACLSDNYTD